MSLNRFSLHPNACGVSLITVCNGMLRYGISSDGKSRKYA